MLWHIKEKFVQDFNISCSVAALPFQHLLPPIEQTIHFANITYLLSKFISKHLSF